MACPAGSFRPRIINGVVVVFNFVLMFWLLHLENLHEIQDPKLIDLKPSCLDFNSKELLSKTYLGNVGFDFQKKQHLVSTYVSD